MTQISVWKDKWVPRACSYQMQSPINTLFVDAKVAELIDKSEGVVGVKSNSDHFLP